MTQSLLILGRQPKLGLAELESLLGGDQLQVVGTNAALVNLAPDEIPFSRLGGTIKLGKLLHEFKTTDWQPIHDYLIEILPAHLKYVPEGEKLQLGLSTYGIEISVKKQLATALALKKVAVAHKQSTRIVPNKTHELSTAQVLHNKLFTLSGWELFFVRDGERVLMAMTTNIQDIEAYTARDQKRPKRDAKVGMLPPKLAQTIVNLAAGPMNIQNDLGLDAVKGSQEERTSRTNSTVSERQMPADTAMREKHSAELSAPPTSRLNAPVTVLDPFCGTGVVLQEALLMGYATFGTDIDLRMVQYAEENIEWLQSNLPTSGECHVTVADATSFDWKHAFDVVACETYLGRPFSHAPDHATLNKVIRDVDTIHKKFLENLAKQTEKGTTMCLAVPAWKTRDGFMHLPTLDHLEKLGYTRTSFTHVGNEDLIYYREGQIVGRELLVLTRK